MTVHKNPENFSESATPWLLLTLLCLGGGFLRFYNFWSSPMWVDEYGTWWIVSAPTWREVTERALKTQGQSPFYYLLVKLFTIFLGEGPFQLRLPSVIFGIASLALVYPIGIRTFQHRQVALTSVVVFSLSERLIWYSQNARPYALALLLTMLSFLFFHSAAHTKPIIHKIGYVLVTTLLIYSHFVFCFIVIIQVLHLIFTKGWREIVSKTWFLPFLCIAFLCLPLASQLISLFKRRDTLDWVPYVDQPNIFAQSFLILFELCHPWIFLPTIAAVYSVGFKRNELHDLSRREGLRLLSWWFIFPFLIFSATPLLLGVTLFHPRYFLFTYPAAFFLLAWCINNVKPTDWRKWIPTLAFAASSTIFIFIPSLERFGAFSFGTRWDWAGAVRVLATSAKPTDLVIYRTGLVEADLFAVGSAKSYLQSYVGWPIIANLPPDHSYELVSLPFRLGDHTRAYFVSVATLASHHNRVWVIGEGELTALFVKTMISEYRFRGVYNSSHEKVQVTLLERTLLGP
jgi:hypothetical protein